MSVGRLYDRRVAVELGQPGQVGTRLEELRVSFRVQHTANRAPSTATVAIYNPGSVSVVVERTTQVRLFAGYAPVPRLLFLGRPIRGGVSLTTHAADRILTLECSDGGLGMRSATVVAAFVPGTRLFAALDEVLRQTGWARGTVTVSDVALPFGGVVIDQPTAILDRIATAAHAEWYVRDETLYMVPRGGSTPEVAAVLSASEGNLIGTPIGTPEGIRVRALIDETMRPGRLIGVDHPHVPQGAYVVRDALFTGDSGFAGQYYMDITARQVGR